MPAPLTSDDDPLVLPLPEDALLLADRAPAGATPRALAVLALQHHMAALGVSLPLGPTLALEDPERLRLRRVLGTLWPALIPSALLAALTWVAFRRSLTGQRWRYRRLLRRAWCRSR